MALFQEKALQAH